MKQDIFPLTDNFNKCFDLLQSKDVSNNSNLLINHRKNMAYQSETSSEKTTVSQFNRHIDRRAKLRIPYTHFSGNTSNADTIVTRSRKIHGKREMPCVIHQGSISSRSESKRTHNRKVVEARSQALTDNSTVTPQNTNEFVYQNKDQSNTRGNKEFYLSAKYINMQDESISHNMFCMKDEPLVGKGDYFTEISLAKVGFYTDEIKWDNLKTPERRELHPMLHERLCSFVNPDIILLIDEHEFYCHRMVLQCYSNFFDELNNLEAKNYIKLDKGVTKEAFVTIYAWMLTVGQGGFHYLSRENILEVLIACQLLKVTDLEEQCLAFIDNEQAFSEENAFHLFLGASKLKHKPIMELMVPRIKNFFLHLVSSKEFLDLKMDELCTFLQSNYAVVHCEMEMFMSAVRWLMNNWEERNTCLSSVMKCIRFGLMSPSQLVDIRKNPESPEFLKITDDKAVQKMIDDGMAYSVQNSLTGDKADHVHRCNLLKLHVPEPRNLAKGTNEYKTYSDFLKFLQELHKNPRYMYVKNLENLEMKLQQSEESFAPSHDSNIHSQESLYSDNEQDNMFLEKHLNKRNQSLPIFEHFSDEKVNNKKEYKVKKFEECYDQKLFREYTDCYGNKIYKPVTYHQYNDSLKPVVFADNTPIASNEHYLKNKKFYTEKIPPDEKEKMRSYSRDYFANKSKEGGISAFFNDGLMKKHPSENFVRKKTNNNGTTTNRAKTKMSLRESAAIIIQSTYRGFRVRKALFQKAKRNLLEEGAKKKILELREANSGNAISNEHKNRMAKLLNSSTFLVLKKSRSSESNFAPINKTNYDLPGSLYFPHHPSILIFGGKIPGCKLSSVNNSCTIYRYVPENNVWEIIGSLPKPRYHHATAMLKGKIFVIGGSDPRESEICESNIYSENWSFDPIKKYWGKEEKLITPRKSFGMVTFHGYLFVIGGQDKDNRILSSVERYDHGQGKWEEVTPLSEPLVCPAVCVYKNNIWVAGGLNSYPKPVVSPNVYCYDPFKNLWTRSVPLRYGRGFSTLINYDDSLHIIGGAMVKNDEIISCDSIDVWDDRQRKWKLKANMAIPRHGHVVAILGSQVLMIGGSTTKYIKSLNQVDSWCMKTGTWNRQISSLPFPVVGHSLITLPPSTHI